MILILLMALAFLLCFIKIQNYDMGFHLKAGQWIIENLKFPDHDEFSYTVPDHHYVDLHWLYQVVLYLVYTQAGDVGIVVGNSLLIVVNVFIFFCRIRFFGPVRFLPVALSLFIGLMAASSNFDVRPQVLSWTFLNLVLLNLEGYHHDAKTSLWLLPVIMLLWVNCHSLFVLGWVVIFCYLAGIFISRHFKVDRARVHSSHDGGTQPRKSQVGNLLKTRRLDQKLLTYGIASVLVCLINPYFVEGLHLPLIQFDLVGSSTNVFKKNLLELASPFSADSFSVSSYYNSSGFDCLHPVLFFHVYCVMAPVALAGRFIKKRAVVIHEALVFCLFYFLMAMAVRNIALFILAVSLPTVAAGFCDLSGFVRSPRSHVLCRTMALVHSVALVVFSLLLAVLIFKITTNSYYASRQSRTEFGYGYNKNIIPVDAINFIKENHLNERIFNHINFGGMLMFMLGQKVYIDTRTEVYGPEFFSTMYGVLKDKQVMLDFLKDVQPQIVIFPHRISQNWHAVFQAHPDWRLVFVDDIAAVYLRRGYADQIKELTEADLVEGNRIVTAAEIDALLNRTPHAPQGGLVSLLKVRRFPHRESDLTAFLVRNQWEKAALYMALHGLKKSEPSAYLYFTLGKLFLKKRDYARSYAAFNQYIKLIKHHRAIEDFMKTIAPRSGVSSQP
ncbi:MAG: hypothetical protein HQM16_14810 [Deltaproteobacteria bacterium]|nr:hypothetical protein [Deltaproteobacteria bacterium]